MNRISEKDIDALLLRFLDGHTTVEEERILERYFSQDDVPERLADYQTMFRWFAGGMQGDVCVVRQAKHRGTRKVRMLRWMAAAAVLLLGILTLTTVLKESHEPVITLQKQIEKPATPAVSVERSNEEPIEKMQKPKPMSIAKDRKRKASNPKKTISDKVSMEMVMAENKKLREEMAEIEEEMAELRRQVIISQMETRGYRAVYMEDGSICFENSENQIITEL